MVPSIGEARFHLNPLRLLLDVTFGTHKAWSESKLAHWCDLASAGERRKVKAMPPPRDSRFGSPLKLSRVRWVRPAVVVEVTYLTWPEGNLLRQVSYQGQRQDKPARQV